MVRLRAGGVLILGLALSAHADSGFIPLSSVPAEFQQARSLFNTSPVASETFQFGPPSFTAEGGQARVALAGAQILEVETLPQLPYVERVFDLPAGAVGEVSWEIASALKSDGPVPLKVLPETEYWTSDPSFQLAPPGVGNWIPGKPVTIDQVGGKARVRVYPLQWNRATQELIQFPHIKVRIDARVPMDLRRRSSALGSGTGGPTSLIVAPKALQAGALLLQESHRRIHGLVSDIVWVEDLDQSEPELAETDLPEGYKDRTQGDAVVTAFDPATGKGYHYSRARKIAHYLQERLAPGSALRYITLLGDGNLIPPSYYFSVRMGFGPRFGVTDQCYASVQQCTEPRATVGRLPFHSDAQVKNHLAKVETWVRDSAGASSEVSLYGGKGLSGPFYIGELSALRALSSHSDWRGAQKNFRTLGNYSVRSVEEMIRADRPSPIVYSVDHGTGNRWHVERDWLAASDIAAITKKGGGITPLIFSIACSNGAFDETLSKEEIFTDSRFGDRSVGVELLLSPAGAVSYFGSARASVGAPIFEVDGNGNLDLKGSNHGLKILDTALEHYRQSGQGRLGDVALHAYAQYAGGPEAGLAKDRVRWTFFNTVLLGDPTLPLPVRTQKDAAGTLASAVDEIEAAFSGYFPRLILPTNGFVQVRFKAHSDVRATLLRQSSQSGLVSESVVESGTYRTGLSDIAFNDHQGRNTYFLRLENTRGVPVERQVWFRTQ